MNQDVLITDRPGGEYELACSQYVPRGIDEVFAFFAEAGNLERITPPFLRFQIASPGPIDMKEGTLIDYRLRVHGIPIRWRSRIEVWEPPHRFVDLQVKGPYRLWHHEHRFQARDGGTLISDRVRYRPPGGAVVNWLFVRRDIARIFAYRGECIVRLFGTPSS